MLFMPTFGFKAMRLALDSSGVSIRKCNMKNFNYSLVLERLRVVYLFLRIVQLILLLLGVAFNYGTKPYYYEYRT
jgi:hypothetical protein